MERFQKLHNRRLRAIIALMTAIALFFTTLLYLATIANGLSDGESTELNTVVTTATENAARGNITDRYGQVLVTNRTEYNVTLDVGNSGTTTRLISGILAGQRFSSMLDGDDSIRTRPMKRIMEPLTQMGADIRSQRDNGCAPLLINGRPLHGIHYTSKVASAQVKSCILLAGMYADAPTSVTEPSVSRNHSELMLNYFGAQVDTSGTTATTFSPDAPCTRAQAVTFLFRGAIANGLEAVTLQELVSGFSDAASLPGYAVSAMNWALANGIVQGNGGALMPNNTCTRGQIVTFLYRASK